MMAKKKEVAPVVTAEDAAKADTEATALAQRQIGMIPGGEQPAKPKKSK
jgi:hypothetical protein